MPTLGAPASEKVLIERARAGDSVAFGSLVDAHANWIYRTLRGFSLQPAEADEVAQEVFLRAWRGLATFNGDAKLSTWLYRITYNEAHRRLARRDLTTPSSAAPAQDDVTTLPDSPEHAPDARALDREFQKIAGDALARLPEEWRIAVMLRDIEGLSPKEAAEVVGVREAAFKSRLHRGRMRLRELLEPYLALSP
jgi:RNA polymerase sigma-70 factor (ECF subfamily)